MPPRVMNGSRSYRGKKEQARIRTSCKTVSLKRSVSFHGLAFTHHDMLLQSILWWAAIRALTSPHVSEQDAWMRTLVTTLSRERETVNLKYEQ